MCVSVSQCERVCVCECESVHVVSVCVGECGVCVPHMHQQETIAFCLMRFKLQKAAANCLQDPRLVKGKSSGRNSPNSLKAWSRLGIH